jgi:DNA-binding transcriptional LysR family regulator
VGVDLDLSCVSSFLVLLREGHYGRAAERLHVSQPTLTRRVQRLERQVGVPLLLRDASGVAGPTAAGARFAAEAPAILHAAQAARAAARGERGLTVRLGVPGPIGDFPERRHLAELARRLTERHPDVRLVCRSVPMAATSACVVDGYVDVMWGTLSPAPSSVELSPLLELERIAVVPTEHDLAEARQVSAADLADRPLLYIPSVAPGLMAPFVLGDVRPVRRARLVESHSKDSRSFITTLQPGQAAVIGASAWPARLVKPGLRDLRILDLPRMPMYAGKRRADRREPVLTLVSMLPGIVAGMRLNVWDPDPAGPR